MLISLLLVSAGLILLTFGADRLVNAAVSLSHGLGVSPLIVGLIVVGMGTSAPEIFAGVVAALQERTCLAIGNAVGSNIANIGLVLGFGALLAPVPLAAAGLGRKFTLMFLAILASLFFLRDLHLSRMDAWLMIAILGLLMADLAHNAGREYKTAGAGGSASRSESTMRAMIRCLLAAVLLLLGAEFLVHGAVQIVRRYGLSELVIGLTIVAVGTSLPELAAVVASAWKRHGDIAVGTIIGSNMFNALVVTAVPGMLHPGLCPRALLIRDFPVMIALTVLMGLMIFMPGQGRFSRPQGAILLPCFLLYLSLLYFHAPA